MKRMTSCAERLVKEYDDRANLGSASGDESNLFLDKKRRNKNGK
jgi:hypothetical protein